jgi:DNA-binding SARP family transcriptional activator
MSPLPDRGPVTSSARPEERFRLRVHILGAVDIQCSGRRAVPAELRRTHVLALLLLLALERDRSLDRDEVCDALWPNSDLVTANGRLHHTVLLLRRALMAVGGMFDPLHVAGGRVTLDPRVWTDAGRLHETARAVTQGRATPGAVLACLEEATQPAPFPLPPCALYDRLTRELSSSLRTVGTEWVRTSATVGDSSLLRQALSILDREGLVDETSTLRWMDADWAAGRINAVRERYRHLAPELAARLGLKPSRRIQQLALRAERALDAPRAAPNRLIDLRIDHEHAPWQPEPPLLGRATLLERLDAALMHEGGKGVALCGPTGIGKSRLARELFRSRLSDDPDLCCWIALEATHHGQAWLGRVAEALGLAVGDGDAAAIRTHLETRPFLLVIDAGPHDAVMFDGLAHVLPQQGPGRVLLVCRRTPTEALHEILVPPLPLPDAQTDLARARLNPAVALFLARRPGATPSDLTAAQLRAIIRIVHHARGLPLAIELSAALSTCSTPSETADALDARSIRLTGRLRDLPPHHRIGTTAWTGADAHAAAHPDVAAVLPVIALFNGAFDLDAVIEVAAGVGVEPARCRAGIESLIALGLVERRGLDETGAANDLRVGGLFATVAIEALRTDPHRPVLEARHSAWVAARVRSLLLRLARADETLTRSASDDADWVDVIGSALDELVALDTDIDLALRWMARHDHPALVELVDRLGTHWLLRGIPSAALGWTRRARRCEDVDVARSARLALLEANLWFVSEQSQTAELVASEAVRLAANTGEVELETHAACLRLRTMFRSGRGAEGFEWAATLYARLSASNDGPGVRTLRAGLCLAAHLLRHPSPVALPEIPLPTFESERSAEWFQCLGLACAARVRSEKWDEASTLADQGARLAATLRTSRWRCEFAILRSEIELGRDNLDAAEMSIAAAHSLASQDERIDTLVGATLLRWAQIRWQRGDANGASELLHEAAPHLAADTAGWGYSEWLLKVGIAHLDADRLGDSIAAYRELARQWECYADTPDIARVAAFGERIASRMCLPDYASRLRDGIERTRQRRDASNSGLPAVPAASELIESITSLAAHIERIRAADTAGAAPGNLSH